MGYQNDEVYYRTCDQREDHDWLGYALNGLPLDNRTRI